ncbi:AAA family ATPase [Streptomyces sp. NP160]|uniref:ATP-binding protein n=1 Tax=Streptomyces sp. NP160 TaxID=2586637 RepID=UPI001118ED07|nr:GNAT family N-acetyltransferase [Streptomyces sp. NP160]TNM61960.1 AAA family ATPase [Streptomyces sp. NP160]
MSRVTVRPFHADDVEGVLALWEASARSAGQPVYGLAEVLASCEKDHAVVAHEAGRLVGAVVGRAAHAQGWVVFLGTAPGHEVLGTRLLAALEREMTGAGLTKLSALLADDPVALGAFHRQGFTTLKDLHYLERDLPLQRAEVALLGELGGRMLSRDRWDAIGGMTEEKGLLERRLVIPLAHPDVADRFGVAPPRAVVLFGPPGTGKTTFAKAIASRLEWPFVEVFPSRLAADPAGLAGALRETFAKIAALEHVVVFIDEVEEIAGRRGGEPPSPLQGVTNELLKIIPAFREQPGRLLVCATNFIRAIDGAFLRHGRFDYVLPIGLPDAAARHAIWRAYLPSGAVDVDLAEVVARSEGFSPADIEFAARRASQAAMEHALGAAGAGQQVGGGVGGEVRGAGPTTQDYLRAVASTRATVSAEAAAEFAEDITTLARV